ncbi:hypothetical protein OIE69_09715 [Actinacidiphila glaucinigra]|uniref:hypothetical protein n=1 Tax=Actinacidiphila glaucinigra TaxID=235986 RepID=UPI002DD9437D|nr:hypothetical protein [Actinacidiphila glaucinigra]WSD59168.1 hypothetical protein OIE69_09715 [Actinacidiphila glaucinigra]
MGIEVAVHENPRLGLLAPLVPYSIHSEGWSRGAAAYSTGLWGEVPKVARVAVGCVRCGSPSSKEEHWRALDHA